MCLCVSSNYKYDYQSNCNCCLPGNMDRTFQIFMFRLRPKKSKTQWVDAQIPLIRLPCHLFPTEVWFQLYKDRVRSLQHWSICTQLSVSSCVSVTQTWLFDDFITNCILQYLCLVLDFTSDLHPCETLTFRWILLINRLLFIHFRVGNWSEIPKCLGWTKVNNLLLGCCTSGLTFELKFLLWNQNRLYVFPNWEWCALPSVCPGNKYPSSCGSRPMQWGYSSCQPCPPQPCAPQPYVCYPAPQPPQMPVGYPQQMPSCPLPRPPMCYYPAPQSGGWWGPGPCGSKLWAAAMKVRSSGVVGKTHSGHS